MNRAERTVDITPSGIVLDGREEVLLSASLFYFRIPRELWLPRLEQVKATGYRVIDVYLPWNFHELRPGEWSFDGRRDVGEFLDAAQRVGLDVIARPGPYICSEWDGGGLPAWLSLDRDLRLRQNDPKFLTAVAGWFERVVNILAPRQAPRGGNVIAVQVENELDFFDCLDRPGYQAALRDLLRPGLEVPLIACAGQGDWAGASGMVADVIPTFNFYPDDASPDIEDEVSAYARLLRDAGLPLLITETNRPHATLRRLLVSGAKLTSPYLQASGYNFGLTPSVGNWGKPGSFMSHDYDFGGYLTPTGEERPEVVEARVLSQMTEALGDALARAELDGGGRLRADPPRGSDELCSSRLLLDGGGSLTGYTNVRGTERELVCAVGAESVMVPVAPGQCRFVLRDLPLQRWGVAARLEFASSDLIGIERSRLTFASDGTSVVAVAEDAEPAASSREFAGGRDPGVSKRASTVVRLTAPRPGSPVEETVVLGGRRIALRVLHPADVVVGTEASREPSNGAPAPEGIGLRSGAEVALTRCHVLDHPEPGIDRPFERAPQLEEMGVWRGRAEYETSVRLADALLIEGAADIVDVGLDGSWISSRTAWGVPFEVDVRHATTFAARVESWGHSNFHDVRLPALEMGSLRGLGRVWDIVGRSDISGLWAVEGKAQWAQEPAPLRNIGGWSSSRVGEPVTYARSLGVDGVSHYAVKLEGLVGGSQVEVRTASLEAGARKVLVTEDSPWIHLSPNESHLSVTLPHLADTLHGAELLKLREHTGWNVRATEDTDLLSRVMSTARSHSTAFPVRLAPGERTAVEFEVPDGGVSIRMLGTAVRATVLTEREILGRLWLSDPSRPSFTGGDPGRIWLPAPWNTGTVRVLFEASGAESGPAVVEGVVFEPSNQ